MADSADEGASPGAAELHPVHHLKGDDARWANALLRLVAGLPLYGVEKSFKLGPGELLRDRFLLGLKPAAYARLDLDALRATLAMPERSFASMATDLKRANFLGLAYESGGRQRVFKAYVEFPVPARRQPGTTPGSVAAHMIYHGYKWDPDRGEDAALTQYWWAPQLSLAEIVDCVARHQAGIKRAELRTAVQQIIARCARDCDASQFQYIEAREGAGSRVSYDLNVYPAALPLAEIAGPLKNAALALAVDPLALEALLAQSPGRTLGHVSAGTDRHGQDFLTIYHEQ